MKAPLLKTVHASNTDTVHYEQPHSSSCILRVQPDAEKTPQNRNIKTLPFLTMDYSHGYCSTLWLPSHPVPSADQQKQWGNPRSLFPEEGWAARASFCLHQNTHNFQIKFTEYFVYCPVPNLRPFIGQRGGMKDMKEENGVELLASCCRLESRQVGTEMKQVLKRVIYSGETRALSDIWVRERNQYPWFPLVFRVLKAEVVAEV